MERSVFLNKYWRYYLLLESKLINTFRFVEPVEENYETFSNEFVLLIQSIGAELDLLFKQFCALKLEERHNINDYYDLTINKFPEICESEIGVKEFRINLRPFFGWNREQPAQSLRWWYAYNCIKHNRIMSQHNANLENVLNILGALFLLEMKYIRIISDANNEPDVPDNMSKLFYIKGWESQWRNMQSVFAVTY